MTEPQPISIDHAERFEHLPKAPIIEAVIDLRARAEAPWEEADITRRLKEALADYPARKKMVGAYVTTQVQVASAEGGEAKAVAPSTSQVITWLGVRAESADGRLIAMFTRDGFTLSRLSPYEDWQRFRRETLRLWEIHAALAGPSEVQRLGVRFINRLEVPIAGLQFSDYFNGWVRSPVSLPTGSFLYQDTLVVPGHPYLVNLLRTFQPSPDPSAATLGLLLDIDAICPEPFPVQMSKIEGRLADLHWLKNRAFFSAMTRKALDLCR